MSETRGLPSVEDVALPVQPVTLAVAKAIYNEGAFCGECEYEGWDSCSGCRRWCLTYASAAIAAMPGAGRNGTALREFAADLRAYGHRSPTPHFDASFADLLYARADRIESEAGKQ